MNFTYVLTFIFALPISFIYYFFHTIFSFFDCATRNGKNKLVLITGAAGEIGFATVKRLLEDQWHVIATDINEEALNKLPHLESISKHQSRLYIHHADVANDESVASLLKFVKGIIAAENNEIIGLNAFVSVAGLMQSQPIATLSDVQLNLIFNVNALGPIKLINKLMPMLLKTTKLSGKDRSCNISVVTSLNARTTWLNAGAYAATKHCLNGYLDTLRREIYQNKLQHKIKVSMIEPGPVATHMALQLYNKQLQLVDSIKAEIDAANDDDDAIKAKGFWLKGIENSAKFTKMLVEKYKISIEGISATPDDVAKVVLKTLKVKNPKARYVVCGVIIRILFYLVLIMPEPFGDYILANF